MEAGMVQIPVSGAQTVLEIMQAFPPGDFGEREGSELIAAAHATPGSVPAIAVDDAPEGSSGQVLHELRKNGLALVHGDNLHRDREFQPAPELSQHPRTTKPGIQVAIAVSRC